MASSLLTIENARWTNVSYESYTTYATHETNGLWAQQFPVLTLNQESVQW